jgi:thiol-disulfide isomerase/thioredoxin
MAGKGAKAAFAIAVAAMIISLGALSYYYFGGGQKAFSGGDGVPPTGDDDDDVVQDLAPDFTYYAVNGGTVSLSSLRGKVVVLDFMATWCQPCKDQIDNLKTISAEYSASELEIISVNVDLQVTENELLQYRADRGAGWDFVTDSDGVGMEPRYSVTSIPTIVIIDKQGSIAKRQVGLMGTDALRNAIDPLL